MRLGKIAAVVFNIGDLRSVHLIEPTGLYDTGIGPRQFYTGLNHFV